MQKEKDQEKEKKLMEATLAIKQKYGKNALLKGTDFKKALPPENVTKPLEDIRHEVFIISI